MTELLAPAGDLTKLKLAFRYGADAVYLGGKHFSLRASAANFTLPEIAEGISYAHARGKKVYVAANIFARDADFGELSEYFRELERLEADGVLVSDLGVLRLLKKTSLKIHISTQANTTNREAAAMWQDLGASRVVLARELTLPEIAEIHAALPSLELEAFVHGAMCISYSGRCYLSDYLSGRPSNRGECAQPCREAYELRVKGKEGWMPVTEDGKGTYLLNSRDLCLAAHLPGLTAAGVSSFKIEGRMKSEYYLATVVNAYRKIIDMGCEKRYLDELETLTHREYTTGFLFGEDTVSRGGSQIAGTCEFVGIVRGYSGGRAAVEMRSRFHEGERLEILSPHLEGEVEVADLRLGEEPAPDAKLVQAVYTFECPKPLSEGDILRRRKSRV